MAPTEAYRLAEAVAASYSSARTVARAPCLADALGSRSSPLDSAGLGDEVELVARADAELAEDLVQVVLDGARADEQLGADLWVGEPFASEPRDLFLLRRELIAGVVSALARLLARSQELVARAFGEPFRAHRGERVVREPQLLASVNPPILAPQPLAV